MGEKRASSRFQGLGLGHSGLGCGIFNAMGSLWRSSGGRGLSMFLRGFVEPSGPPDKGHHIRASTK